MFNQPHPILVVEDNPGVAKIIQRLLDKLGRPHKLVESGSQACLAAQQGTYSIILMDLNLPDMSGLEVARQIRSTVTDYSPWIVAVTGMPRSATELYLGSELNDYLSKPLSLEPLRQALLRAESGYAPPL